MKNLRSFLCILLLGIACKTFAQKPEPQYIHEVQLTNGTRLYGTVLRENATEITLQTDDLGEITVPREKIESMERMEVRKCKNKTYWFRNPNATRYLFAPSAIPLRRGEGYYQNAGLFLNSAHVGVTKNISVGGGLEIITAALGKPIFFLAPKISFPVAKNLHIGAGALYANMLGMGLGFGGFGMGYGMVTYGSADNNLTVGAGFAGFMFEGEMYGSKAPTISMNGMLRLGRNIGLVSENYLLPIGHVFSEKQYYGVYSYGMRFMGERITVDVAFMNTPHLARYIPVGIPYLDFVYKFGGKGKN